MKRKNGFTLVELLAVIVILAVLMIIAIPAVLNTVNSVKKKTFGEYITKIYETAQKQYYSEQMLGQPSNYVRYDITKDIGLDSTGNYKGYVVFIKNGDSTDVYIGVSDDEYHTATKFSDDNSSIVNYINYSAGGEPEYKDTLEKFNGINAFTNGATDTFNLPDFTSREELIEIKKDRDTKDEFENELRNFYNKVINTFESPSSLHDTVNIYPLTNTSGEQIGDFKVGILTYEKLFGGSGDANGFALIVDSHYYGYTPDKYVYIAYKNKNYHTVNQFVPNDTKQVLSMYTFDNWDSIRFSYTDHVETITSDYMAELWDRYNLDEVSKSDNKNEIKAAFLNYYRAGEDAINKYTYNGYPDGINLDTYYTYDESLLDALSEALSEVIKPKDMCECLF